MEPTPSARPRRGLLSSLANKRAADLVRQQALRIAIFNSADFSSIATDEKGVIQLFNVGAERMLGYAAAEVVARLTPADLFDARELVARATALSLEVGTPIAPGFEALTFKASRGLQDLSELTWVRKDGSRFPALVSVSALRDVHGRLIGYLLIGTDNTARKQVEVEQKKRERRLHGQQAKSEFLSKMSHELRSPLNAILGFAQLMQTDPHPLAARHQEYVGQILHAGWHLLGLINELLEPGEDLPKG